MFLGERKRQFRKKEKDGGMFGMLKESFTFSFCLSFLLNYFLFFLTQKSPHLLSLCVSFFPLLPSVLLTVVGLHLINMQAEADHKQQLA